MKRERRLRLTATCGDYSRIYLLRWPLEYGDIGVQRGNSVVNLEQIYVLSLDLDCSVRVSFRRTAQILITRSGSCFVVDGNLSAPGALSPYQVHDRFEEILRELDLFLDKE